MKAFPAKALLKHKPLQIRSKEGKELEFVKIQSVSTQVSLQGIANEKMASPCYSQGIFLPLALTQSFNNVNIESMSSVFVFRMFLCRL